MKAVALFAETQVELLILGAFVVEESIYWIYRGVRTLFSQPGSACPRVMSSIAESAEFRAGFQRQTSGARRDSAYRILLHPASGSQRMRTFHRLEILACLLPILIHFDFFSKEPVRSGKLCENEFQVRRSYSRVLGRRLAVLEYRLESHFPHYAFLGVIEIGKNDLKVRFTIYPV